MQIAYSGTITMGRKAKAEVSVKCCGRSIDLMLDRCNVEALVNVDDRGQMVLPKDLRAKVGILPGDKLAVVSCENREGVQSLVLIKAEALSGIVQNILGPMMGELRQNAAHTEPAKGGKK